MSMIGNLARIPETKRIELHKNPELIESYLYPEFFQQTPPAKKGFLSKLFGAKPDPQPTAPKCEAGIPDSDQMNVDKAWHTLHYLFTGSDWEGAFPQGFLVSCGKEVGVVDVGYGPARSYSSTEVKEISKFLDSLNEEELKGRLDPLKMSELQIYPSVWEEPNLEEEWNYAKSWLDSMKVFLREASERDLALLVYIN